MLSRRQLLHGLGCGALSLAGPGELSGAGPQRLNFVFVLVDDMGWKDLACYGSRFYETPHIDRLARQGMRFTDAYAAAPVCSPSRASIMTGKYPARLGMTHITQYRPDTRKKWISPETASGLALSEVTIPEALKSGGYVSAIIGKWHLGKAPLLPENRGFDVNAGATAIAEPPDFFYPAWRQNPKRPDPRAYGVPLEGYPGEYLTDRLTDEAVKFIKTNQENPFFLYLSHYAVHVPIQAKQEKIAHYQARVRSGDPQNSPVYAAMVESVDESVGRIVSTLEELGLSRRTVIIFMSDNGGLDAKDGPNTPATSNLPLRMGKLSLYEGGIREPMIVKWPGVVKPGSVCHTPVIGNDFLPTIVEAAGLKVENPVDGLSLIPLLKQKGALKRDALYWHYPHYGYNDSRPSSAIRAGNFKLQEFFEDGHLELYDLAKDIGETKNLADKLPQKAAELREKLDRWRKAMGAKTGKLNPAYAGREVTGR